MSFKKGYIPWNKGKNLGGQIEYICKYCGKKFVTRRRNGRTIKYCSHECYAKDMVGSINLKTRGKKHHFWKGEKAAYSSIHDWIRAKKGNANEYKCLHCDKQAKDWANVDHLCSRNLEDYLPLCRKCHIEYDKK